MGKESTFNAGDKADVGLIPRSGNPLEEEMIINSCIHAWRIPWKEEPGGLQSVSLQGAGCNCNDAARTHACRCL